MAVQPFNPLRPRSFEDYVGQEQAKSILQILCKSALKQGKPICHCLLSGPPGLGKTTLARIVANEMGAKLIELVASNLSDPQQLTAQLATLKEGDILFIDEMHALSRTTEEALYLAMEDGRISVTVESEYDSMMQSLGIASSKRTRTIEIDLPRFSLIGATTLEGLVSAPLRSRFVQSLALSPYSKSDLEKIVLNASRRMNVRISKSVAKQIAMRSRSSARIAIGHLQWIIDYATASEMPASVRMANEAFLLMGVDENGLRKVDHDYLRHLIASKRPIGLSVLAAALGQDERTIVETIEPYLLQRGYIRRDSRGRVADPSAVAAVNKGGRYE